MAYINVEVDLDEFTDDELMDELKSRGLGLGEFHSLESISEHIWRIWELRRIGKSCEAEIDRLISDFTGRIL